MNINPFQSIKSFEIFVGFAIIIFAVFIGWKFSSNFFSGNNADDDKYNYYYASFVDIDGLTIGSDVKIAGIPVGKLISYTIDDNYKVVVKLSVQNQYKISDDSSVIVATNGFIGQRYLKLAPGFSENTLKNEEEILITQSSINIETILSLLKK